MLKKILRNTKCPSKAVNFVSRKCSASTGNAENDGDVTLHGDVIQNVTKFSYLGDVLSSKGVQEAVTAKIRSGKKSLRILQAYSVKDLCRWKLKETFYKNCMGSARVS